MCPQKDLSIDNHGAHLLHVITSQLTAHLLLKARNGFHPEGKHLQSLLRQELELLLHGIHIAFSVPQFIIRSRENLQLTTLEQVL